MDQRPVFKAHVNTFTPLKKVAAQVEISVLRNLTTFFKHPDEEHQMDETYQTKHEKAIPENVITYKQLQKLRAVNLVYPVGHEHMYYAALAGAPCKLTSLGQFYWKLVKKNRVRGC